MEDAKASGDTCSRPSRKSGGTSSISASSTVTESDSGGLLLSETAEPDPDDKAPDDNRISFEVVRPIDGIHAAFASPSRRALCLEAERATKIESWLRVLVKLTLDPLRLCWLVPLLCLLALRLCVSGRLVPRASYLRCVHRVCKMSSNTASSIQSSSSFSTDVGLSSKSSSEEASESDSTTDSSSPACPKEPKYLIAPATNAEATEKTAPIFAWACKPGSTKASFATKSATVRPTPPSAETANKSLTLTPAGRAKPSRTARSPKPAIPSVFPATSAATTESVIPPIFPSGTPAFAKPKKNMPRSTGNFNLCSNSCNGACLICDNIAAALSAAVFFLSSDTSAMLSATLLIWLSRSTELFERLGKLEILPSASASLPLITCRCTLIFRSNL
mmetsp:Transcript_122337/g.191895  ORF Transcript_122337/g.191895 Transcript_122337/m.191895 type:complete len:390 (-) Transcript_122337:1508-2677(-)